jgi:hypothetical protein
MRRQRLRSGTGERSGFAKPYGSRAQARARDWQSVWSMRIHAVCILVIAGCSEQPAVDHWTYDDVAQLVGATVATSDGGATTGALTDSLLLARGEMPAGFVLENGMAYGNHGALRHEYVMVECRDHNGTVLKPCNQLSDASTLVGRWTGLLERADFAVQSDRQGMWTIADLQSSMPSITGSSKLHSAGIVNGLAYRLDASETESMLTPTAWLGGTVHLELDVAVATEPSSPISADVTFDGAVTTAWLVLDGEHMYRIDLASGTVD